jgi:hypothetical protein
MSCSPITVPFRRGSLNLRIDIARGNYVLSRVSIRLTQSRLCTQPGRLPLRRCRGIGFLRDDDGEISYIYPRITLRGSALLPWYVTGRLTPRLTIHQPVRAQCNAVALSAFDRAVAGTARRRARMGANQTG